MCFTIPHRSQQGTILRQTRGSAVSARCFCRRGRVRYTLSRKGGCGCQPFFSTPSCLRWLSSLAAFLTRPPPPPPLPRVPFLRHPVCGFFSLGRRVGEQERPLSAPLTSRSCWGRRRSECSAETLLLLLMYCLFRFRRVTCSADKAVL